MGCVLTQCPGGRHGDLDLKSVRPGVARPYAVSPHIASVSKLVRRIREQDGDEQVSRGRRSRSRRVAEICLAKSVGLFRRKGFTMGVAARFLSFLGGSAVFFIMPFYLAYG